MIRLNPTKKSKKLENKRRLITEYDKLLDFGKYMVDKTPKNKESNSNPAMKRPKFDKKFKKTDKKPKKYKNNRKKH